MGIGEVLAKVKDPYERKARLYPALLALSPVIVLVVSMYNSKLSMLSNLAAIIGGSCGGLWLLSNLSREMGKRLENEMYSLWGGKPTTQLLRHRHEIIEGVTKKRYHAFLSAKIKEPFPDATEELADPKAADDVYQSAVRWLLTQTRDVKKFDLLFKENITYGFRRNALGLKYIGLVLCAASFAFIVISQDVDSFSALSDLPGTAKVTLLFSGVMFSVWCAFITTSSLKTAAFSYAEMLLRACDQLKK